MPWRLSVGRESKVPWSKGEDYTHVLPQHVHAHLLQGLQIKDHPVVRRRRVDTIRPVPLIQRAEGEQHPAVEQDALDPGHVSSSDRAEAGVAGDRVGSGERDRDIVQRWRVGGPEPWTRNGELERGVGGAAVGRDDGAVLAAVVVVIVAALANRDFDCCSGGCRGGGRGDVHCEGHMVSRACKATPVDTYRSRPRCRRCRAV